MARTDVPVKHLSRFAVASYFSADLAVGNIVDGMRMVNDGASFLYVANTGGSPETVTVLIPETIDFQPVSSAVFTISNLTQIDLLGVFPSSIYGNVLEFDVSSASLSFGAFSLL